MKPFIVSRVCGTCKWTLWAVTGIEAPKREMVTCNCNCNPFAIISPEVGLERAARGDGIIRTILFFPHAFFIIVHEGLCYFVTNENNILIIQRKLGVERLTHLENSGRFQLLGCVHESKLGEIEVGQETSG